MTTTFNARSSFTADGVAYRRLFTDIPLAKEIWDILLEIQGQPDVEELKKMENRDMLAFFEARYLLTDRELKKLGATQILELAPGLSSRGMMMTGSPATTYVEIDLPDKMASKQKIVQQLIARNKIPSRPNLYLEAGNVISSDDFKRATSHFDLNKPIAVICEGLLRYISFEDKKILAQNISDLLKKSGGAWITPDIEFLSDITEKRRANYTRMVAVAGFDVIPNLFRDEAHARSFFEGFGFAIAKYPLMEVRDQLASPKKAGLTTEQVEEALQPRSTYVMTVMTAK